MNKLQCLAAAAIVISVDMPAIRGAIISDSDTFTFRNPATVTNAITNSTPLHTTSQSFAMDSGLITLGKFDTALGTLNSIEFSITFSVHETSGTVNLGSASLLSDGSLSRTVTLNINNAAFTDPIATSDTSVIDTSQMITIFNGGGTFTNVTGPGNFSSISFSGASQLLAVSGAGSYTVSLKSIDVYSLTQTVSIGSMSLSGASDYSGTVRVDYNYTPVPEPKIWGVISAMLLLIVMLRRRRRWQG